MVVCGFCHGVRRLNAATPRGRQALHRVNACHPALGLVSPFPPIRDPASRLVLRVAQVAGLGELREDRGKAKANAAASCAPRTCGKTVKAEFTGDL